MEVFSLIKSDVYRRCISNTLDTHVDPNFILHNTCNLHPPIADVDTIQASLGETAAQVVSFPKHKLSLR